MVGPCDRILIVTLRQDTLVDNILSTYYIALHIAWLLLRHHRPSIVRDCQSLPNVQFPNIITSGGIHERNQDLSMTGSYDSILSMTLHENVLHSRFSVFYTSEV